MKIGYVGDSKIADIHSAKKFRLASYSPEKFLETAAANIEGLQQNIEYAHKNNLLFYRIRSELIPFASHPICTADWQSHFKSELAHIGDLIKQYNIRISFHPDQFVVLNAPSEKVVHTSIAELAYQAQLLQLLGLDTTHKLQIHVGGMYGNKQTSMERFISIYKKLPDEIRNHLVIENDDRLYTVSDCLYIHNATSIPVIFDNFHHELNGDGKTMRQAMEACFATWQVADGIPMVDYSSQQTGMRLGKHAEHIDIEKFKQYLAEAQGLDFDIMLEIKDKDVSALQAQACIGDYV